MESGARREPPVSSTEGESELRDRSPADMSYVLEAFRGALDRQFTLADRLTTKARQAFVLSIGFFTIVQAVAFSSFESSQLHHWELPVLLGLAIASILCLALAAAATVRADVPVEFGDFKLDDLGRLVERAYMGDPNVPGELGQTYYTIIEWLRESNELRDHYYKLCVRAAALSISVSTVELVAAMAFRIP
jgi:hypothetical protein